MASKDNIEIEIVLDNGKIVKGFKTIEGQSKKTGKTLGKNLSSGLGALNSKVLALGVSFAAVFGGRKLIQAAIAQEEAVNNLNIALKLTGKFTESASKEVQLFADNLQAISTVGDEATLEVAALIQSLGNLEIDGLKRATAAAADLSAQLGIDLKAAALLVGKAAAGEVSSFSRYGLIIKKGATNAETFTKALTALESKFGGAAAAKVNTFSGAFTQLSNAFGDTLEEFGFAITKSTIVISLIKGMSKSVTDFNVTLSKLNINQFFGNILTAINDFKNTAISAIGAVTIAFLVLKSAVIGAALVSAFETLSIALHCY